VPTVRLFPSYGINEHFSIQQRFPLATFEDAQVIEMVGKLAAVLPQYGVAGSPMDFFTDVADLGVVFMPRSFHYEGDTFDERFVFAGPCLRDRSAFQGGWERQGDRPLVFVSLGTAATGWPEFFPMAVEALGGTDRDVVMATGDHVAVENLGALPANVRAVRHVPQLEVLRQASVFVTHGGMNSVMESLYHGVPMVVVPQMNEQRANALRVAELGLGVHLDREGVDAQTLAETVSTVAEDTSVRANVTAMREEIRRVDGPTVAADAVEAHLSRQG
jgi:MGT family glycosyltransferase